MRNDFWHIDQNRLSKWERSLDMRTDSRSNSATNDKRRAETPMNSRVVLPRICEGWRATDEEGQWTGPVKIFSIVANCRQSIDSRRPRRHSDGSPERSNDRLWRCGPQVLTHRNQFFLMLLTTAKTMVWSSSVAARHRGGGRQSCPENSEVKKWLINYTKFHLV